LMLLIKLADFAIARDERMSLATAGRKRGGLQQNRVVMIDGLFSNLSDPKLIRESFDAIRGLRGRFQLIGWIHNLAYENDVELFPEHLGLRRLSNGLVVAESVEPIDEDEFSVPVDGQVAVIEMHADRLPDESAAP